MTTNTTNMTESLTTLELVGDAVDALRDGDVILGSGEVDYAAADLLNVLADLDIDGFLNLDAHPEIREFARLCVEGWPL